MEVDYFFELLKYDMDEINSKNSYDKWKLPYSHNFHVKVHAWKKVSKVKFQKEILQCKKVKQ